MMFNYASRYLTECYVTLHVASAWASTIFLRYLCSFVFPLSTIQIHETVGVGWATSLLELLALVRSIREVYY